MKSAQGKKPTAQGVGESKPHIAPEGTFEPTRDWSQLTIQGEPIPRYLWDLLTYEMTDQGAAEKNAGKEFSNVRVSLDAHDKRIIQRKEAVLDRGLQAWEAPDPRRELIEKHVKPGERPHFLSPSKVAQAGTRGWVPVLDEQGREVKLGEMILATMPEDSARQREAMVAARTKRQQSQSVEQFQEQQAQMLTDAGVNPRSQRAFLDPTREDGGLRIENGTT